MENALHLLAILAQGADLRFWGTVLVASVLKWLFTPKVNGKAQTIRESIAGIIAGIAAAYYGSDWVIANFENIGPENRDLVIIMLVITGEHIVRAVMQTLPGIIETWIKSGKALK